MLLRIRMPVVQKTLIPAAVLPNDTWKCMQEGEMLQLSNSDFVKQVVIQKKNLYRLVVQILLILCHTLNRSEARLLKRGYSSKIVFLETYLLDFANLLSLNS